MAYAAKTEISLERSISEIVKMLKKNGAERIGQVEDFDHFAIQFFMNDRMIRFKVGFPSIDDMPTRDGRGSTLSPANREKKRQQWIKQRGRALFLVIKAKMESIESNVETFEEAFLANVVMSDGRTLYERVQEPIAIEYQEGKVSPLMLSGPEN